MILLGIISVGILTVVLEALFKQYFNSTSIPFKVLTAILILVFILILGYISVYIIGTISNYFNN